MDELTQPFHDLRGAKRQRIWTDSRKRTWQKTWAGDAELDLMRHYCHHDFWMFFLYAFGAGINPKGEKWIEPDVHEPMARWFQKHIDEWFAARANGKGIKKNLAILVHRGVGKTTMISQAGQTWLHLRDPEMSSYTGSEKIELAAKILDSIKSVLEGADPHSLFGKMYGNWSTGARTWTGKEVRHAGRRNTSKKDPSLGIFGVETSITGAHPDAIFYDDPISYERILSDANWLNSVNTQVTSLIPVIQSDGLVVWVGTRYDDDDHFGRAFREEGVRSVEGHKTDAIVPQDDGVWDVYFMAGRDAEGKPTTTKVWPENELLRFQKRDPLRYAAQVMNDPELSEYNPITKEQIEQCGVNPDDVPWHALWYAILCDTAFSDGSKRASKDESVFIVHGYPRNGSGDVYIIEGDGSPYWRAEDYGSRLVATVQRYRRQGRKIRFITDEYSGGGKGKDPWEFMLRNMFHDVNEPMPQMLQFNRGGGPAKAKRMATAASFWVDGHVKYVKGAPGVERLLEQMKKIGQYMVNSRLRNDWADAHSDAFHPDIYQPMKRFGPQRPPYDRGARPIEVEGLDTEMFDDSPDAEWLRECPRAPIRQ